MVSGRLLLRTLVLSRILLGGQTQAVTIQYTASALPDLVAGGDRWCCAYVLSGSFSAFCAINLLYPTGSYTDLDLTAPPDALLWFGLITQPDPGLGADGLLGLTEMTVLSADTLPFAIEFVWRSSGSPGAQDCDAVDFGSSTLAGAQAVPKPGSLSLVPGGLGLQAWRTRRLLQRV